MNKKAESGCRWRRRGIIMMWPDGQGGEIAHNVVEIFNINETGISANSDVENNNGR